MKKLIYPAIFSAVITLSACNSATQKTGGASTDSGSHGSSGAVDTAATTATEGAPTSGTDTSTNGKTTANPTVDSVKKKP